MANVWFQYSWWRVLRLFIHFIISVYIIISVLPFSYKIFTVGQEFKDYLFTSLCLFTSLFLFNLLVIKYLLILFMGRM